MIGINDVPSEKFQIADAQQLAAFASSQHIGMLGMWQLGRDSQCAAPATTTSEHCSGVTQSPWQFSQTLNAFAG
jgi:chitinase